MAAAEFIQKDANSITLNRHEFFYTFEGTFGRKDNIIFASGSSYWVFYTALSPSKAAIFQPQSTQVRWLMAKMQKNGEQSHTLLSIACFVGSKVIDSSKGFFCENQIMIPMVDSQLFAQSVVLNSTIWKTSAKIEKIWCLNRIMINVSNNFLFFVSCEIVTLFILDVFYSESSMLQLLGCKCAREWSISNPQ